MSYDIRIIAPGRIKKGPLLSLWDDYTKRLNWPVKLVELDEGSTADEQSKISKKIQHEGIIIALDETGTDISSIDLARKIEFYAQNGQTPIQFIIGGADGLSDEIREKADFLLSFGSQTWPHKLVRIMLIEQIYRAQTIINGHPYHRS